MSGVRTTTEWENAGFRCHTDSGLGVLGMGDCVGVGVDESATGPRRCQQRMC